MSLKNVCLEHETHTSSEGEENDEEDGDPERGDVPVCTVVLGIGDVARWKWRVRHDGRVSRGRGALYNKGLRSAGRGT